MKNNAGGGMLALFLVLSYPLFRASFQNAMNFGGVAYLAIKVSMLFETYQN